MASPRSTVPQEETPSVRAILLVGSCAALIFVIQAVLLWNFGIDDVGISYRYAVHLAQGWGLAWNPGQPPVEGFSNFLWVLILALGNIFGGDVVIVSKLLGLLFAVGAIYGIGALSSRLWGSRGYWWLPPMLVAITPEWTAWAMSGLEIALYAFFLVLGFAAITRASHPNGLLLATSVCGLALTRPEGAIIGILILIAAAFNEGNFKSVSASLRTIRMPLLLLLLVVLGLAAFRRWYFGYFLPNTVHAKFDPSLPSRMQVLAWLFFCAPFLFGMLWLQKSAARRRDRVLLFSAAGVAVAQMAIALPVSPVMYFLHRYQIAFLPLIALLAPALVIRATARGAKASLLVTLVLVLWCAHGWPAVIERYRLDRYVYNQQTCAAARLAQLPGHPTIAIVDAGRIPFWSELPAIDAWGLCDVEIARKGFDPSIVLSRRPEVYIMSVDVNRKSKSGRLDIQAHLGMDIMTTKLPEFSRRYKLWKVCSPGVTPSVGDSTSSYYDYGIFLDSTWAGLHGLGGRLAHVDWPY